MMLRTMRKMIARYGTPMVLVQGGQEHPIRAFLQETGSRSQENAQREFSPLGEVYKGLYVYIGPVEPMAAAGDALILRRRRYELRRAEPVYVGGTVAYCWGLCVEKGGESTWGS